MGAFMNALREEGTREDILRQLERVMEERESALRKAARYETQIKEHMEECPLAIEYPDPDAPYVVTHGEALPQGVIDAAIKASRWEKQRQTLRTVVQALLDHSKQHRDIVGECNILNCTVYAAAAAVLEDGGGP